ncbi:hypothetical protein HNP86_001770 [Methanococcus maripaludis]|uniref:Uncharacterized protein n=1 Tax=Methanococcus maripaludis TaxID=39152 RepID=A0A7J9NWC1_METMI|nr:hypothetical protein [Methanococcus maripaludis]MBA2851611.1 hypothetical protein [Methanococcus maripaludis]
MDLPIIENEETAKHFKRIMANERKAALSKLRSKFRAFHENISIIERACKKAGYELDCKHDGFYLKQPDGVEFNEMVKSQNKTLQCLTHVNRTIKEFNRKYSSGQDKERRNFYVYAISRYELTVGYQFECKFIYADNEVVEKSRGLQAATGVISTLRLPPIGNAVSHYFPAEYASVFEAPTGTTLLEKNIFTDIHEWMVKLGKKLF